MISLSASQDCFGILVPILRTFCSPKEVLTTGFWRQREVSMVSGWYIFVELVLIHWFTIIFKFLWWRRLGWIEARRQELNLGFSHGHSNLITWASTVAPRVCISSSWDGSQASIPGTHTWVFLTARPALHWCTFSFPLALFWSRC